MKAEDVWAHEKALVLKGYHTIAGIDEAGRGPLAGPVVSAAVVLPPEFNAEGLTDSKKLTPRQREALFQRIYRQARAIGIGLVDAVEIDRINILQAAKLAMVLAVENLKPQPQYLLIDGNFSISSQIPQQSIVKGDARCISISAASVVAKVSRDRLMQRYHEDYPQFGFDRHKGYPTPFHQAAIAAHGPSPIHRVTFNGVRQFVCERRTASRDKRP